MYVSKVELKNIRGIGPKGLTFDLAKQPVAVRGTMAGWNVVAGPNGSGKSTFLQGMAAALLGGTGTGWLLRPADRMDWIHRGRGEPSHTDRGSTCAWVEPGGPEDELPPHERRIQPVPLLVEWSRDPGAGPMTMPLEGDHSFVLRHFWNASAYGSKPDGWLFAAYGASRGNRRSSPDAADLFKGAPRTAAVVTLFREDAALETASTWLLGMELNASRSNAHAAALRDGVLRLLGHGLLVDRTQTPMRVEAEGIEVEWNGGWRPSRLLGDGNHAVVALVVDLLQRVEQFKPGWLLHDIMTWAPGPAAEIGVTISGTVVIDEPEMHLHPELQQRLGFWLKRHFPKIQFIVTTHSPFICQAADPGGLFRMPSLQKFAPADAETWANVANGTLDDAVVSELFGMEHAQSEESIRRRRRFGELEVRRRRGPLSPQEHEEHERLARGMPTDPNYEIDTLVQGLLKK